MTNFSEAGPSGIYQRSVRARKLTRHQLLQNFEKLFHATRPFPSDDRADSHFSSSSPRPSTTAPLLDYLIRLEVSIAICIEGMDLEEKSTGSVEPARHSLNVLVKHVPCRRRYSHDIVGDGFRMGSHTPRLCHFGIEFVHPQQQSSTQ